MRECPPLPVYQYNKKSSGTEKAQNILWEILSDAFNAPDAHGQISAIPPDLYVMSEDIESHISARNCLFMGMGVESVYEERADWHPTIHGIEGLIDQCPDELRAICPAYRATKPNPRVKGKKQTKDRDILLQQRAEELLESDISLSKTAVAKKLKLMREFKSMSIPRIKTIIRIAKKKSQLKNAK